MVKPRKEAVENLLTTSGHDDDPTRGAKRNNGGSLLQRGRQATRCEMAIRSEQITPLCRTSGVAGKTTTSGSTGSCMLLSTAHSAATSLPLAWQFSAPTIPRRAATNAASGRKYGREASISQCRVDRATSSMKVDAQTVSQSFLHDVRSPSSCDDLSLRLEVITRDLVGHDLVGRTCGGVRVGLA